MNRDLAETLLAKIMQWTYAQKAAERAALEAFASYKYDEYQQFAPGRRFLESLALWLRQFPTLKERQAAYEFVKNRLIFISEAEMSHLVELAFPMFVRPLLVQVAATEAKIAPYRLKQVLASPAYRMLLRQTLVLGLSDGASTDRFRRANPQSISNEQIWHAYDVSAEKAEDLGKNLRKDLGKLLDREPTEHEAKFRTVVLLDDFTASGTTYLRKSAEGNWSGKIPKIVERLEHRPGLGQHVADTGVRVVLIIYAAAPQAVSHIRQCIQELPFAKGTLEFHVVHVLSEGTVMSKQSDPEFWRLVEDARYFDAAADDEHGKVGGQSVRYGYAACKLPVVLSHNTPNNSVYLLWAEDGHDVRGLFPRVSRHRQFE